MAALAFTMPACSSPRDAASVLRDAQQAMGSVEFHSVGMNAFLTGAHGRPGVASSRDVLNNAAPSTTEQRSARVDGDELRATHLRWPAGAPGQRR